MTFCKHERANLVHLKLIHQQRKVDINESNLQETLSDFFPANGRACNKQTLQLHQLLNAKYHHTTPQDQ